MKTRILIITTSLVLFISACTTHTHIVGKGAQGTTEVSKRQLWVVSLVPINDVDTNKMAGDAMDYEIKTQIDKFTNSNSLKVETKTFFEYKCQKITKLVLLKHLAQ